MHRKIVRIAEDKCNGCGQCVKACAEGAIALVDGKARLVSDTYCDGLGACLGECPQGAITIEERSADAFDEEAAKKHVHKLQQSKAKEKLPCGCPGTMARQMKRQPPAAACTGQGEQSQLTHWPVQLKLVPPAAPYLEGADLLLVADCVPFAFAGFHTRFLSGRAVVIGCPKLDDAQYYIEKLATILKTAAPRSVTVVHMEVPCCSGLTRIAHLAHEEAELDIPLRDVTIGINGEVLLEQ